MKKTSILILVLIVALGAIGVGYAAWSQTLDITGNVDTGSLSAAYIGSNATNVPVGDAEADATYTVTGDDGLTLTVNVTNAYPGLNFDVPFYVKNWGTVPINVAVTTADTNTLFIVTIGDPGVVNPGDTSTVRYINFAFGDGIAQSTPYSISAQLTASQHTP